MTYRSARWLIVPVAALSLSACGINSVPTKEEAAKANPWAFGEAAEGGVRVSSGAEHGTPPTGDTDAVTAAFKAMNPGIKID